MISNYILTIVIPAYNVESTIWDTVSSIFDSRLHSCCEILIVNDGSTDSTPEILQRLKQEYSNVKVVNKANGGHGSVINTAISLAQGKYFRILDGDDWIESSAFDSYIECLLQTDADLIISNYVLVNEKTGKIVDSVIFNAVPDRTTVSFEEYVDKGGSFIGLHAFTIKTLILRDNSISVDERVFYEDTQYVLYPIVFVNTILISGDIVYRYRVASDTQSINPQNVLKNRGHRITVIKGLLTYYSKHMNSTSAQKKNYYLQRTLEAVLGQYRLLAELKQRNVLDSSEIDEIDDLISQNTLITEAVNKTFSYRITHPNPWFSKLMSTVKSSFSNQRFGRLMSRIENRFANRYLERRVKRAQSHGNSDEDSIN